MFLPLSGRDDWSWPTMREIDDEFRQLSALLRIGPSARCDRNGVLTLTPNYRYDKMDDHLRIEVDLPGVEKTGLSVEVHDSRLKIVAAKYSTDSRAAACHCNIRRRGKARSQLNNDMQSDAVQPVTNAPPLPSVVYKLDVRLSSRADGDAVTAGYRGDGVLRLCIPLRAELSRRVVVNVEG